MFFYYILTLLLSYKKEAFVSGTVKKTNNGVIKTPGQVVMILVLLGVIGVLGVGYEGDGECGVGGGWEKAV